MPALEDAFVGDAGQHLFQIAKAEGLPGAIDGGEQLARDLRGVGHARRVQAVVAIAAGLGRGFTKVAQQHGAAAGVRFDQPGKRIEPHPFAGAAMFFHFADALARAGKIIRAP